MGKSKSTFWMLPWVNRTKVRSGYQNHMTKMAVTVINQDNMTKMTVTAIYVRKEAIGLSHVANGSSKFIRIMTLR